MGSEGGHSVLLVPVPALEPFVRGRWEHYDPALVSTDPAFTHAHITVLAPFLPRPTGEDLARVGEVVTAVGAFDFRLAEVRAFPDGVIHLRPDPLEPFAELTARLWEAFPGCAPYEGRYGDVVPHLTLDLTSAAVTVASTRARLGTLVPATCRADRVELHWYETGSCHVAHRWPLDSRGAGEVVRDAPAQACATSGR